MNIKIAALPPGMIPLGGEKPTPLGDSKSVSKAPSGVSTSQSGRPSKEEKEQVMRMQDIMRSFGESIDKNKDLISKKFNFDISDVERLSGAIRNTGSTNGAPSDGIWGPNTQAALDALSNFLGMQFASLNGNYKNYTAEEVISFAKKNVDSIVKSMNSLGFAVPKDVAAKSAIPLRFDSIPEVLTETNSDPRSSKDDKFAVTSKDLGNIWSFYNFISSLSIGQNLENAFQAQASNEKITLEKIASQILSTNIVRLSQYTEVADDPVEDARLTQFQAQKEQERAGAGAAGAGPIQQFIESQKDKSFKEKKPGAQLTVAQFTGAVRWFARRANMNLLIIQNSIKSGEENLDGTPVYSQEDLDNAIAYNNAMQRISNQWFSQVDKHVASGSDPKSTLLDPINLSDTQSRKQDGSGRYQETSPGLARTRTQRVNPEGFDSQRDSLNPPIQYEMDLYDYLHESGSDTAEWLKKYMDNTSVRLSDFSTRSPENVASMYMSDAAKKTFHNDGVYVMNLALYLNKFINEILTVWRERARGSLPSDKFRSDLFKQQANVSKWKYALDYLKQRADTWRAQLGGKPVRRRV